MEPLPNSQGIRIAAIAIIWPCAAGMLAISIPLVSITHSDLIPVAILIAATIGTLTTWRTTLVPNRLTAPANLKHLEQRLTNLEAICTHGELIEQYPLAAAEPTQRVELDPVGSSDRL